MPLYPWRLKEDHEVIVEIQRTFDEYDIPPTAEEIAYCGHDPELESEDWERFIGKDIKVTYAQGSLKGRM